MSKASVSAQLEAMAASAPAKVSLLWQGMAEDKPWAAYRPDEETVSASTIKTPLMMALLDRVQRGEYALDARINVTEAMILPDSRFFEQGPGAYPLDEIMRFMITVSDNSCTNILIRMLGMEAVNGYFASLGLHTTRIERLMLDFDAIAAGRNNYTTAREQFMIFSRLYHGGALTEPLCRTALEVLKDNRDYELFYRYLPRNLTVAHKSGGLPGLAHDSGIFYRPGGDFYLGIFVSEAPDEELGPRLIGAMARKIWDGMAGGNA